MSQTPADLVATNILIHQARILGSIAWEQAAFVQGLRLDPERRTVKVTGKPTAQVLAALVQRFEELFGPAAREVCIEGAEAYVGMLHPSEIPAVLRTKIRPETNS